MTGHIFIEGEVGSEVTIKSVRGDIALYPQATEFIVHINSVGGDVYDGYAIGNIIKSLGKPTTASIGALCASISTYIACCCDQVLMGPAGDFMIHLPTGTLQGNANDFRQGAEQLDRIKSELIARYLPRVAKAGLTPETLSAMMEKETSMSPQEAKAMGFIDGVQEKLKAVAKWDINKFENMNLTKEEAKGFFEDLGKKLDNLASKFKAVQVEAKNVAVTLADGSIINSDAADPNAIVGSNVTDEQGAPLSDGTYETADGLALVVAGGVVQSADPTTPGEGEEMAKLKQENEALKQQLAAQTKAVSEQKTAVQAVAKQVTEFKNVAEELKAVKKQLDDLKNSTIGDTAPPVVVDHQEAGKQERNPMIEAVARTMGEAYFSSRNY